MCYLTRSPVPSNNKDANVKFDPMPEELLVFSLIIYLISFLGILTMLIIRWSFSGAGKVEVKQRGMQKEIQDRPCWDMELIIGDG